MLITTLLFANTAKLPEEFYVTQRFLSLTTTFDIGTELERFAVARKRFFALTTTFDLEDMNELPIATASARFFSWGTVADVADPAGEKIGWIEEEIFRLFSWSEYRVFNANNQIVAIAKMNFWGTEFEVYHPNNRNEVYATMSRPFCRCFRDEWTIRIHKPEVFEAGAIDPRLLVMLTVYQTDNEERARTRAQIYNQLMQDNNFNNNRRFNEFD